MNCLDNKDSIYTFIVSVWYIPMNAKKNNIFMCLFKKNSVLYDNWYKCDNIMNKINLNWLII